MRNFRSPRLWSGNRLLSVPNPVLSLLLNRAQTVFKSSLERKTATCRPTSPLSLCPAPILCIAHSVVSWSNKGQVTQLLDPSWTSALTSCWRRSKAP